MSWRDPAMSPEAKAKSLAALEQDFDEAVAEVDAMTPEELTLSLARDGHSPEDLRRGLAKALERVVWWRVKDERDWVEFEINRLTNEGGR